ncbi:hypothetical protein SISSUDRAFT_1063661 [Sistotremastrum suecicum HHB10207 ss-3]|uniref:Uncharacterized protein n=1 Tax=Sistotremastrum suecicum HHB10207 ss-3 TaxID=1314776 RepID=A0A166BJ70_9AGAM|nr:hypothetical protein SISSUDRAFT_1063661 [Sistotremastrum suecicum HHB10207 ss-3]
MSSKPRPLSQPSASSGSSHQHPHPHTVTSSRPFPSRSASSGLTPLTPFPSSPGDSRQGTDAGDDEDGDVASLPSLVRSLASFPMMTSVDVRQLNFGGGVGTRQASQEKDAKRFSNVDIDVYVDAFLHCVDFAFSRRPQQLDRLLDDKIEKIKGRTKSANAHLIHLPASHP